jgi:hypothetical protein
MWVGWVRTAPHWGPLGQMPAGEWSIVCTGRTYDECLGRLVAWKPMDEHHLEKIVKRVGEVPTRD